MARTHRLPVGSIGPRRAFLLALLVAVLVSLGRLLTPGAASGHAGLLTADPAPDTAVADAPTRVRLRFTEPVEPRFSGIEVLDASRRRVDLRDFRVEGTEDKAASVGLGDLPDGTYTVRWHNLSTVDGHALAGAFAFTVGDAPAGAGAAGQTPGEAVGDGVPLVPSALVRALGFLAMATLVGAFGFRTLVLAPTARAFAGGAGPGCSRDVADVAITARSLVIGRAALVALWLATLAALALQAVVASRRPLMEALGGPMLALLGTRYGVVWMVRVVLLVALTGLLLFPRVPWRRDWPWLGGFAAGAAVLLTTSLVGHGAASGQSEVPGWVPPFPGFGGHTLHAVLIVGGTAMWFVSIRPDPRRWWAGLTATTVALVVLAVTSVPVALDWLHLVAMALWIGGLVQLLMAVPRGLRELAPSERNDFLRALIPRFSALALPCVVVLTLTGIYAAWFQVRHLEAMTGTVYGLTLVAKLVLFVPLVGLGAANLYLGSARLRGLLRRLRPVPSGPSARRFFGAVRAEALLVILVLLATGVLTSLSPAGQVTGAEPRAAFSETREGAEGNITLSVDPAVAGLNTMQVRIEDTDGPVADASKVAVRASLPAENIGEREVVALPAGRGRYMVHGPVLGVAGDWRVEIVARRPGHDDARATFTVPVRAPLVATARGVRAEIRTTPAIPVAGRGTELELVITDARGDAITPARTTLSLLMPAHEHEEDVVLTDLGGGRYTTAARLSMSGEWLAQVRVERAGQPPVDLRIPMAVAEQ